MRMELLYLGCVRENENLQHFLQQKFLRQKLAGGDFFVKPSQNYKLPNYCLNLKASELFHVGAHLAHCVAQGCYFPAKNLVGLIAS